ncbi:MAG: polyamine aminopropyltransferase [bacterium]|nr:polyamine aminopropyltransferase [bacterium]
MKNKQEAYFFEGAVPFEKPQLKVGFLVKKKLYSGKSLFQKIDVLEFANYGTALILDDIVQTTVKDEFIYHEMLNQVPLFLHPSPKKVLVVGGGDGGSLEEVLKHKNVKKAVMAEIDGKVVEVSRKYLPSISKDAFTDKRAELLIEDGWKYLKGKKNEFDVIILDLSDPEGPAKSLISLPFYRDVKKALKRGGIVSVQSGSFTTQPELVATISKRLKKVFRHVAVRRACVPAYQAGEYTFTVASDYNFPGVLKQTLQRRFAASKMRLRFWSPAMHEATAVLPEYLKDALR